MVSPAQSRGAAVSLGKSAGIGVTYRASATTYCWSVPATWRPVLIWFGQLFSKPLRQMTHSPQAL